MRTLRELVKIALQSTLAAPLAVVLGALCMAWPALYNRFPLIYPDTLDYIQAGRNVERAVLTHQRSTFYGDRSLIYSLTILPLHFRSTVWPLIAAQCLLTSFVLWLVFRSIIPSGTGTRFVLLMMLLGLLTGMSWFASFAIPDILGPALYLSIYLLIFARDTLSRAERAAIYLISSWAIASHASHLLVVLSLFFVLALLAILQHNARRNLKLAAELTALIAFAVGAQTALNSLLYGRISVFGSHPPFLTARIIADGPGRWYLEKHCGISEWEMCKYVSNLSGSANRFMWSPDGVWMNAPSESKARISEQEARLAIAVLRAYPLEQLSQSSRNFLNQLKTFDLRDAKSHPAITAGINDVLHQGAVKYFASKQAHDQLPWRLFDFIQHLTVALSLIVIAALLPWLRRSRPSRLIALGFIIAFTLIANALFTSTLSMVAGRFESRLIWLVPFFAGLCAFSWQAPGERADRIG